MYIIEATRHALVMVVIGTKKCIKFPVLLLLIGLCITSLSLFFTFFFLFQHFYFGVSVTDFDTVIDFLGCPVTTHILQTLFCLVSFTIGMAILVFFGYCATYILISEGLHKQASGGGFFSVLRKSYFELLRHSVIMTCGFFAWLFSILYIDERFEDVQDICDGTYVPDNGKYDDPYAILLYPLLITHPGIILRDARSKSVSIMKKTFSDDANCQYTFKCISYIAFIIIASMSYALWQYSLLSAEYSFILGLVLFIIYWSVIKIINIAFSVSVYHYCVGEELIVYPKKFVELSYK